VKYKLIHKTETRMLDLHCKEMSVSRPEDLKVLSGLQGSLGGTCWETLLEALLLCGSNPEGHSKGQGWSSRHKEHGGCETEGGMV
jgi:hypothetical protein